MQKFTGQEFVGVTVDLDGKHFERCRFTNCKLIYRGGEIPIFTETSGDAGAWEMADAADRTLNFLRLMYRIRPEMVDQIFSKIRM